MEAYKEQLKRINAELVHTVPKDHPIKIDPSVDLVIVNGEGSLHSGRRSELIKEVPEPAILMNTVWQDNPPYDDLKKFRFISVRESLSLEALPNWVDAEIIPDIIFTSNKLHSFRAEPLHDLGITDGSRNQGYFKGDIPVFQDANGYLETLCLYRRICTGRFHTIAAASVLGIPFSAYPSNTHKIKGLMRDIGLEHNYYSCLRTARKHVPTIPNPKAAKYTEEAKKRIESIFDRLHTFI